MTHDPTFWLLARAAGLTAYTAAALSVLMGLVLKSRPLGTRLRPPVVLGIHRTLALSGLLAIALHGVALVLDSTVHVSPLALVVPGLVDYRPWQTALGVVAGNLMLVVYASFSVRRRIGMRAWRVLHWTTYAIFGAATAHGLLAGTDSAQPWALGLYLGALFAVVFAAGWRFLIPYRTARPRPERSTA